ncbi:MAG: NTP transferase domain-containing protein [Chthoniobacteraceae bacterium]
MLQVIIPMGGRATRFQERGYTFPKPLIEIGNQSMIELVIRNLAPPADSKFTFICRKEYISEFYLGDMLRLLVPDCRILPLERETAGALCSVLLAIDEIDPEGELLVANGDQYFASWLEAFLRSLSPARGGWLHSHFHRDPSPLVLCPNRCRGPRDLGGGEAPD